MSKRVLVGLSGLVAIALQVMPGCIAWDIKDQIALSNENLAGIEERLGSIDQGLTAVNAHLDSIDGELDSMDAHLAGLRSQLDATNTHLQSLRKTINSIDSTIPFLKISGDSEDEKKLLEGREGPGGNPGPTGGGTGDE